MRFFISSLALFFIAACGLTLESDPPAEGSGLDAGLDAGSDGRMGDGPERDSGRRDAPRLDADPSDGEPTDPTPDGAFVDAVPCLPTAETCNLIDDDCDGSIDEEFDLTTNPDHCGACGDSCPAAGLNQLRVCDSGSCLSPCIEGYADCVEIPAGCESDLSSVYACGDCTRNCRVGTFCNTDRCELSCRGALTRCGDSCVDTARQVTHCGACDNACPTPANGGPSCEAGECRVAFCFGSFHDCNSDFRDGCEIELATDRNNCGACDNRCVGLETCRAGVCTPPPEGCRSSSSWGIARTTGGCIGACDTLRLDCSGGSCTCSASGMVMKNCAPDVTTCHEAVAADCCYAG